MSSFSIAFDKVLVVYLSKIPFTAVKLGGKAEGGVLRARVYLTAEAARMRDTVTTRTIRKRREYKHKH